MIDLISIVNSFAQQHAWVGLVIGIYLIVHQAMKGIRDAIDTTPATDDNWFERAVTISGKFAAYFAGFRAKK